MDNVIDMAIGLMIFGVLPTVAQAQKHSPVWESFLSRIYVGKVARDRVDLENLFKKTARNPDLESRTTKNS